MNCLKLALTGTVLLPLYSLGADYAEVFERLELDNPELVVHMNTEDDFSLLGTVLSQVYLEYLKTAPDIPPVPVSFEALFTRLGFTNLESVTIASERIPTGYLNQSMSSFEGQPIGLFAIFGTENQPFQIIHSAPEDADIIGEFTLNATALLEIVQNLAVDIMGPMGQGLIDAQLDRPLNEAGLTTRDIIAQMNTRVQVAMQTPRELPENQQMALALISGKAAFSFQGMGNLLEALSPMLQGAGFTVAGENGLQMQLPLPQNPLTLILQAVNDNNDLLVSFSEEAATWFVAGNGSPAALRTFQDSIGESPQSGLVFFFDNGEFSRLQAKTMWANMELDGKFQPMLRVVEDFAMRFTGPQLSHTFVDENHQRTKAWQPASTKANMGIMAVVIPAAMAIGYGQSQQQADDAVVVPPMDSGSPSQ